MERIAKRVRRTYALALGAIALIAVSAQVLVHHALEQKADDAEIINVSGRQRMLSQRIAKASLALGHSCEIETVERNREELQAALELFVDSEHRILSSPATADDIRARILALRPSFRGIIDAAHAILGESEEGMPDPIAVEAHLADLLVHEAMFLPEMDAVVGAYQAESDARLDYLERVETGLLFLTIGVLVFEVFFVFEPMRRALWKHIRLLRESRAEALEAAQAKDDFLATVSHELRTPLNGILGMNHLLLETELDEEQIEYSRTCEQSAEALLAIVDDILDLTSLRASGLTLDEGPVDVARVVEQVTRRIDTSVDPDRVELRVDLADDLPATFHGDAARLEQVLVNLAGNAAKFTEEGSIRIYARTESEAHGGPSLVLGVEDTGPGIEADRVEKLFETFSQGDGSKQRRHEGLGLGLTIAHEIVERMGGRIGLDTEVGRGSRFEVRLPLPSEAEGNQPAVPEKGQAGRAFSSANRS